jgi:Tir chaperone family protein CesT
MLKEHLPKLCEELKLAKVPSLDEKQFYHFKLETLDIAMRDLEPGYLLVADIASIPEKKKEECLLQVMKANFLGQGTGGATIGLKEDETSLTLSWNLAYEMNYKTFKDTVEEFINYLDYWKRACQAI